MATKRGKVSSELAVVLGPDAEVSVIYGLNKRTTDRLARAEYERLHGGTPGVGGRSRSPGR
jgi:hypothetical protein